MKAENAILRVDPALLQKTAAKTQTCFLVNHGDFYSKEISNGILFVPETQLRDLQILRQMQIGDLLLHCSRAGLSALGCVTCLPYRSPFPAWRFKEGKIGARGWTVEFECVLLSTPIAISDGQVPYVLLLDDARTLSLKQEIFLQNPNILHSEWIKKIFES